MPDVTGALQIYSRAVKYIVAAGLDDEVTRQRQAELDAVSESTLLRESAWVVLCSGFREATVRRIFDNISLCFCDWESSAAIVESYPGCFFAAQSAFRNAPKLLAIVDIARRINEIGFDVLKPQIVSDPITVLRQFPYIGPITVWHLAKNLGFDVPKPDRHLVRAAQHLGFSGPDQLCAVISEASGEAVKVVDLVIWRYLADNSAGTLQDDGLSLEFVSGGSGVAFDTTWRLANR